MTEQDRPRSRIPNIGWRVLIYVLIILGIYFARGLMHGPSDDAMLLTVDETEVHSKDDEVYLDTKEFYPEVTFYGWSHSIQDDGRQRIEVLLRLNKNYELLEWKNLELRTLQHETTLCTPEPAAGSIKPAAGVYMIAFVLPENTDHFSAGRIWCWNDYLCMLSAERKIERSALLEALKEIESEKPAAAPLKT